MPKIPKPRSRRIDPSVDIEVVMATTKADDLWTNLLVAAIGLPVPTPGPKDTSTIRATIPASKALLLQQIAQRHSATVCVSSHRRALGAVAVWF